MFYNYDEVKKYYYNGWIGEHIDKVIAANGMVRIGGIDAGFRYTWGSKKPIDSLKAYKGLKARVPEIDSYMKFYENLGAVPTVIPTTEVSTALQQGAIDAVDNAIYGIVSQGASEMVKYLTPIPEYVASSIIVNGDFFNSLSAEDQELFRKAGKETEKFYMEWWIDGEQKELKKNVASGQWVEVQVTDEIKAAFAQSCEKVWDGYAKANGAAGEDIVKKLKAMRAEIDKK